MSQPTPNARETFQELLRELFQIEDSAELDFGIYRIMGQKRGVVEKFIDQELLDVIDAELRTGALKQESSTSAQLDDLATQIRETLADDAIDAEGNLESAYAKTKLGKEYLAVQKAGQGSRSIAELEGTIYNHLYDFFKRYYDKGDFMSLRRYSKREKYAIPYNGEETHFHWSNADQYYIKTGESFTDYRWKDPSGGVRVKFTVTSASVPKDNIKAPEKRFFIPQLDDLTVETVGTAKSKDRHTLMTLPFHYRGLTETEAKRYEELADELGLKNGNGNGGKLQAALLAETVETLPKASDVKAARELAAALGAEHHKDAEGEPVTWLAHHLRRFTVKNTSDYFIHKDLQAFLTRELDFFLKNEVLHLDNLEAGGEQRADGWFEMMRVIRRIGSAIIDFLAQIENFQKRLFEKKKFVTDCHYCITLDRIPEALYPEIAKNEEQIAEWKKLFAIDEVKGWTETPTVAFLKKNLNLVVDTKHFDTGSNIRDEILAASDDLEPSDSGLAANSENFQALSLLEERHRSTSKCVYIDPPYNTSSSEILYKNSFKHSSWGTMMLDRLVKLKAMMSNDGAIFVSIDGHERTVLEHVMHSVFGQDNHIEDLIWAMNTTNSQLPNYSTNHEYVIVHSKNRAAVESDKQMFREPKPGWEEVMELVEKLNPSYPTIEEIETSIKEVYEQHLIEYREQIESLGFEWKNEKKNDPWKGIYSYSNAEYRDENGVYVDEAKKAKARIWVWREADMSMPATKQAESTKDKTHPNWRYYRPKHPATGKPAPHPKSGWKFPYKHLDDEEKRSFVVLDKDKRIAWGADEKKVPQIKRMLHEVETNIAKSVFADFSDGEKQTSALFGESGLFLAPKHASFVSRFVLQATKPDSVVIDCFGGSGSSAHAVLDTNRLDDGKRSFVTVEMGKHFDTLVIPRLKKVIYSADWRSGKPKTRNTGISHCFKYLSLESYEDALGNIAFDKNEVAQELLDFDEYVINYMLDFETSGSETLLNTDKLVAPFDYKLEIREGDELKVKPVDLPETFNFLIGLRVRTRRVYWREVKQGKQKEKLKYLVLSGRTNPHATGGEREVVVIWRTTEGWQKADYSADRTFIEDELALTAEADEVFYNDDSFLRHPNAKSLDPVFKRRMFNQPE